MTMRDYMKELYSRTCACGRAKMPGLSFCGACYWILPNKLKNNLYRPMLNGYCDAYEEAHKFLVKEGRIKT